MPEYTGFDAPAFVPAPDKSKKFKKEKKLRDKQEKEEEKLGKENDEKSQKIKEQRKDPKYSEIHVRFHKDSNYGEAIERRIYKTGSIDHKNDIIIKALGQMLNISVEERENKKPKMTSNNINVREVPPDIREALNKLVKERENNGNLKSGYWVRDIVEEALNEYLEDELKEIQNGIGRDGKKKEK